MSPYIAYVQSLYPKLKYYELAVVRSDPKAKSQYQGNDFPRSLVDTADLCTECPDP